MALNVKGDWTRAEKLVREKLKLGKFVDEKLIKRSLDRRSYYLTLQ